MKPRFCAVKNFHYTSASLCLALAAASLFSLRVYAVDDVVVPSREDWAVFVVWFVFPLLAFAAAWHSSRRLRLKPEEPQPPEPDPMQTFVPSTYGYYPLRQDAKAPALPEPAVTTRRKDRTLATAALVCGVCGLYLPLTGCYFGLAAVLLARPVRTRGNHFYRRAAAARVLGIACLVQTVLYLAAPLWAASL